MKLLLKLVWLKMLHPSATIYVRLYPSQQKSGKVYWKMSDHSGYYDVTNEIIIDLY